MRKTTPTAYADGVDWQGSRCLTTGSMLTYGSEKFTSMLPDSPVLRARKRLCSAESHSFVANCLSDDSDLSEPKWSLARGGCGALQVHSHGCAMLLPIVV